jgi:DNA polymerase-3 subunit epsilon
MELMALYCLNSTEIKDLWPVYNKALKRFEPKYGLFEYEARNGYRYLNW